MLPKNHNHGLSLIEVLLVLAIAAVISTVGFLNLNNYRSQQRFDTAVEKMIVTIRDTERRAVIQEGGTGWGIRFSNVSGSASDTYEVFRGANYTPESVERAYDLGSLAVFSDPAEGLSKDIIFSPVTGLPHASVSINVMSEKNPFTKTITIESSGSVQIR